jgi:uncharacterized damage-inducible protein DinB
MRTRIEATSRATSSMLLLLLAGFGMLPSTALAQGAQAPGAQRPAADRVGEELLRHFETSMTKFIALAQAMPADSYTWSPGAGVMEVGHVFMHVARYNYLYPTDNMGVAAPAGVDLDAMEAVRSKDDVVRALEQSREYVRTAVRPMTADQLAQRTRLYGREVEHWAVLVQLVSHMNEHLGQAIAYARMNGVVPPWSR